MSDPTDDADQLRRAAAGDQGAWGDLLARHRARLRRMVALRLDRRLQQRIDASDVIQDAYLEASRRLAEYLQKPTMPFFLWLRFLTRQKLLELHRRHLGAHMRNADREVSLDRAAKPQASSVILAAELAAHDPRPSVAAMRAELRAQLQEALEAMDPLDREVLVLRHFEQLSNVEAARALGLQESAASKRYLRALKKLKEILASD